MSDLIGVSPFILFLLFLEADEIYGYYYKKKIKKQTISDQHPYRTAATMEEEPTMQPKVKKEKKPMEERIINKAEYEDAIVRASGWLAGAIVSFISLMGFGSAATHWFISADKSFFWTLFPAGLSMLFLLISLFNRVRLHKIARLWLKQQ